MAEILTLSLFCVVLLFCIAFKVSTILALIIGLVIFWVYGYSRGYKIKQLFNLSLRGVKTISGILQIFVLIGILTAMWRAGGTIAVIICYASNFITPSIFLLMTFVLNCMVSVFTGTAFGTVATMGVVTMTMANTMGMNPLWTGGAILGGIYFGDRCSPVSTSALLVAQQTDTDIFTNIKNMVKSSVIPFIVTCGIYLLVGIFSKYEGNTMDVWAVFQKGFQLKAVCLIPTVAVLVLSLCRVRVKTTILVSIICGIAISMAVQGYGILEIAKISVLGYSAENPQLAEMLNGGGIVSMVKVAAIVCIASCYSGIFQETELLTVVKRAVDSISEKTTPFCAILTTAIVTAGVACNQTLSIMLTNQLCSDLDKNKEEFALNLEDTSVVVSPLIPWTIACAAPLALINAPTASVVTALFLYLLPLWRLILSIFKNSNQKDL